MVVRLIAVEPWRIDLVSCAKHSEMMHFTYEFIVFEFVGRFRGGSQPTKRKALVYQIILLLSFKKW
jgi:hypothetical protein